MIRTRSEEEINRSLERLFVVRFRLGIFDPPELVPFSTIGMDEVQSPAHQKLAFEAAHESIVLLKNDGQLLPLRTNPKKIAVVGAGSRRSRRERCREAPYPQVS